MPSSSNLTALVGDRNTRTREGGDEEPGAKRALLRVKVPRDGVGTDNVPSGVNMRVKRMVRFQLGKGRRGLEGFCRWEFSIGCSALLRCMSVSVVDTRLMKSEDIPLGGCSSRGFVSLSERNESAGMSWGLCSLFESLRPKPIWAGHVWTLICLRARYEYFFWAMSECGFREHAYSTFMF